MCITILETPIDLLKKYYGYTEFRKGQEEIINTVTSGRDCLAVMPTGAGKSLCYQIPALMLPGITLVVSPLISLMRDQVTALTQNGIPAAFINSSLTLAQTDLAISRARAGAYKIIYIAPERLDVAAFLSFARDCDISLIAVDEAHCVSQWGQDFRPSYLNIPQFIARLPKRPVVCAFTATATADVMDDIIKLLCLNNPFRKSTGFNRENLYFGVRRPKDKYAELTAYLRDNTDKSGIIYASTRKNVDEITKKLTEDGFRVCAYHAGLSQQERSRAQEDFLYDRVPLIAATVAFGMGIDKSNVSFVIHYNMPSNINAVIYQKQDKGFSIRKVTNMLIENGFLEDTHIDGVKTRIATKKGEENGISVIKVEKSNGSVYYQNLYDKTAQKPVLDFIVNSLS